MAGTGAAVAEGVVVDAEEVGVAVLAVLAAGAVVVDGAADAPPGVGALPVQAVIATSPAIITSAVAGLHHPVLIIPPCISHLSGYCYHYNPGARFCLWVNRRIIAVPGNATSKRRYFPGQRSV